MSDLYKKVAAYYGITPLELKIRICGGETLIHQYYMANGIYD